MPLYTKVVYLIFLSVTKLFIYTFVCILQRYFLGKYFLVFIVKVNMNMYLIKREIGSKLVVFLLLLLCGLLFLSLKLEFITR